MRLWQAIGVLLLNDYGLVYEFDFATRLVENGMRKKYEWTSAYGLFMSVTIIFIRVLELLSKILPIKED